MPTIPGKRIIPERTIIRIRTTIPIIPTRKTIRTIIPIIRTIRATTIKTTARKTIPDQKRTRIRRQLRTRPPHRIRHRRPPRHRNLPILRQDAASTTLPRAGTGLRSRSRGAIWLDRAKLDRSGETVDARIKLAVVCGKRIFRSLRHPAIASRQQNGGIRRKLA